MALGFGSVETRIMQSSTLADERGMEIHVLRVSSCQTVCRETCRW
jgi:hypothetical protein